MHLKAYTTVNCFYCKQLKELFLRVDQELIEQKLIQIDYITVGKDISKEYFQHENPDAIGFPYVIVDGEPIGGLVETAKLLLRKGFVSTKKK